MKKTKKDKIKQYLLDGNSLSQLECTSMFNCTRLAAVVFNLKKEGLNIKKRTKHSKEASYAEYYIGQSTPTRYKYIPENKFDPVTTKDPVLFSEWIND
tara:strand:+ start:74 stop:367 length:294 start_codon:yes stop_codon:yes gene_type:complete